MKIYYGGHSSFMLESKGKIVLIDPFMMSEEMKALKPDIIAVTHGHDDHAGLAVDIAKQYNSPVIAVFELANHFSDNHFSALYLCCYKFCLNRSHLTGHALLQV